MTYRVKIASEPQIVYCPNGMYIAVVVEVLVPAKVGLRQMRLQGERVPSFGAVYETTKRDYSYDLVYVDEPEVE